MLKGDYAWLDNGWKGVDFVRNARCESLDYMTVHIYPDNWAIPFKDYTFTTKAYMTVPAAQTNTVVPLTSYAGLPLTLNLLCGGPG